MANKKKILDLHKAAHGKTQIMPKVPLDTLEDLSVYYTPGVAQVSEEIERNPASVYNYTSKSNTIAIVSDGTRILGLGDIGPQAGLPVMEGKAILFKKFGGVDAVPLCIDTTDEDKIIEFVRNISPTFGGINLEDIESPKSFRIAGRLEKELDIPVFHDDRQGTGTVALAALINSLRLAGKGKGCRIVINGAGSAGFGITMQLAHYGFGNMVVVDSDGAIYRGRKENMNRFKSEIAMATNRQKRSGTLEDLLKGADVFIGASTAGAFSKDYVAIMAQKPIVFALANPIPEIEYADALDAGAFIAATGRSDSPNQVNNLLAFPGIMRGLLDSRARKVTYQMLNSAAQTLANSVGKGLRRNRILPSPLEKGFSPGIVSEVAASVAVAAAKGDMARHRLTYSAEREAAERIISDYLVFENSSIPSRLRY